MADDGVLKFSLRQLPDGVIVAGSVAGPSAWRFDQAFIEPVDGVRTFFSLAEPFVDSKILVFQDGIKMIQGQDITLHPPNVVQFTDAPTVMPLEHIEAWYMVPNGSDSSTWVLDETMGGTIDGMNTQFTTFFPYVSGKIILFKNGVKLIRGASFDYIEINPTTTQLATPLLVGDFLQATYFILL
jgi:hypothetical protein